MIGLILFACTSKKENFGKLIIMGDQCIYENDDIYYPHDYFKEVFWQECYIDTPKFIIVEKQNSHLVITNESIGHKIDFEIAKDLEIENVEFNRWFETFNGTESKYTVEKVIFSVDCNPFECDHITGFYTLQIRDHILSTDIKNYGDIDTVMFYTFNGKFKVYSELEKANGRDWVISQNEIFWGIKDSLDVFYIPDEYAEFTLGNDSLGQILEQFEIERSEIKEEKKVAVTLCMVVDENGIVNPESMTIIEEMNSDALIRSLKNCEPLLNNWRPAIYKDKPVKSRKCLPIMIKKDKK